MKYNHDINGKAILPTKDGDYWLVRDGEEEVMVSVYTNPDTREFGIGFNTRDGGGFMPMTDVREMSYFCGPIISTLFKTEALSPSEAVYGFAAWLTTLDKPITASAKHDAAVWANRVAEFCKVNDLRDPRAHWEDGLIHPS